MSEQAPGLDTVFLTEWFLEQVAGITPPLTFSRIAGGRSNLTHEVRDSRGDRYAHRRPPLHSTLSSAHDMSREYTIMTALGSTPVPIPRTIGFGTDPSGTDFYVTEFVDGRVLRQADDARHLTPDQRGAAGEDLIDVLAAIHAVDPDEVGLGELRRDEPYVARQLRRWQGQWERQRTQDLPLITEIHRQLSERVPRESETRIVHGDYRLENTILRGDGRVAAVLDWELCTLGDPLADLGWLLVLWSGPGAVRTPEDRAISSYEGFPSHDELVSRYAERCGRDLSPLDFYMAFGCWKLAIIREGVYARHQAGAYGSHGESLEDYPDHVRALAGAAADALEALPNSTP